MPGLYFKTLEGLKAAATVPDVVTLTQLYNDTDAARDEAVAQVAEAQARLDSIPSDLSTVDSATAALIPGPSLTADALSVAIKNDGVSYFALGYKSVQRILRKLSRGEDCSLAILSDSTDDDIVAEWGRLLANKFAADYPSQAVTIKKPVDDAYTPGAATVIQTGSGTLSIFNMAIAGSSTYNWQSTTFLAQLVAFNPDLILVATGHNEGLITGDPQSLGQPRLAFRLRLQLMMEEIRRRLPYAERVLIAQHPWSDHPNGDMDQKRDEVRLVAQLGADDFFDMYQKWTDVGSATTAGWYNPGDNVHINATGEQFYADNIYTMFEVDPKWEPRPTRASLLDLATPLNLIDDLVMPLGATAPIGWTLENCTASRETTNPRSARGYDIKLTPIDPTQPSRMYKQIFGSSSASITPWLGKTLLFQAWMKRPAAGGVPNRYVGQMSISDGTNNSKTMTDDKGYGTDYMPRAIPHVVSSGATALTLSLWCDSAPQAGGTPDVTWAGVLAVPGLSPQGWAGRSGVKGMRNAEVFEGVDIGSSTFPAQSRLALFAAASIQRLFAIYSGANRIWQITTTGTESGANVGGDLAFQSFDDSGNLLYSILTLNRRFGLAKLRSTTTALRPSASASGSGLGAVVVDSDLKSLILSDGSVWVPLVGRNTGTTASSATPSLAGGSDDYYFTITALATAITSVTVTGTPKLGQRLHVAITDNGTPRAIAWGTQFEASTVALPTTTVASTRLDVQFIWNAATSKWRCISVA